MPEQWERDGKGRFAKGNRGGYGRPFDVDERWIKLLREAVSDEDIEEIIEKAVEQAKVQGSWRARDFLFAYGAGKPRQVHEFRGTENPILRLLATWVTEDESGVAALAAEIGGGGGDGSGESVRLVGAGGEAGEEGSGIGECSGGALGDSV